MYFPERKSFLPCTISWFISSCCAPQFKSDADFAALMYSGRYTVMLAIEADTEKAVGILVTETLPLKAVKEVVNGYFLG